MMVQLDFLKLNLLNGKHSLHHESHDQPADVAAGANPKGKGNRKWLVDDGAERF